MMLIWKTRGKIIRTVPCCTVYDSCTQWYANTHEQFLEWLGPLHSYQYCALMTSPIQLKSPTLCPLQMSTLISLRQRNERDNQRRTSHPWRSLNPCSSREMPPMTATVRTPRWLPNLIASSSICCASSLVGARIIAYGPSSASSYLQQHRETDSQPSGWPTAVKLMH